MTIYKDHKGAWIIQAVINGYLIQRQYIGFTKHEAMRLFKEEMRIYRRRKPLLRST